MTIYKVYNKYRILTQTVDIVSSYIVLINMIKNIKQSRCDYLGFFFVFIFVFKIVLSSVITFYVFHPICLHQSRHIFFFIYLFD